MIIESGSPNVSRLEGVYAYPLWRYSNQSIEAVHKIQSSQGQIPSKMITAARREALSVGLVGSNELNGEHLPASAARQTAKVDLTLNRSLQQGASVHATQGALSGSSRNDTYENGSLLPTGSPANNSLLGLQVDLLA